MEVVECVLAEKWHRVESSLDDLRGCHAQLQGELDDLIEAHRGESVKSSRRRIKKEIDLRWKDPESLRVAISQHESSLGRGQPEETTTSDDDSSDHGAGILLRLRWLLPQAVQVDLLRGIFCINFCILNFYILKCLVINSSNQ